MNRTVSNLNLNMMIMPLTCPQSEDLEDYLDQMVVSKKFQQEFVCVFGSNDLSVPTLVSYGKYDQSPFSDLEKSELEKELAFYGRKWLKENTDSSF